MSDHIDAALDGAGVCDGGRDGAGVCLLLLVVDAISGRAAALAARSLHASFLSCSTTSDSRHPRVAMDAAIVQSGKAASK